MKKELSVRCRKCLTIADPVCECGEVAYSSGCLFDDEICVYSNDYANFDLVITWLDDDGNIRYITEISNKLAALFVPVDLNLEEAHES